MSNEAIPFTKLLSDFEGVRRFLLGLVSGISSEQALAQPPGFNNTVHWNLGHLLQIQCSFLYNRCGLPYPLPHTFRDYFARGTSPATHDSLAPDWDELLKLVKQHSQGLAKAYGDRFAIKFRKPFTLMNVRAATAGEAISLLLVHEGQHLMRIQSLLAAQ